MTTATNDQPSLVPTEAINKETFEKYINAMPSANNLMTFSDWADREQVRLLRSINSKIGFFVLLAIISILVSLLGSLFG